MKFNRQLFNQIKMTVHNYSHRMKLLTSYSVCVSKDDNKLMPIAIIIADTETVIAVQAEHRLPTKRSNIRLEHKDLPDSLNTR